MNRDKVTIVSYGKSKTWERQNAIDFYTQAYLECDGHEAERYEYIVECLKAGDTYINDDVV